MPPPAYPALCGPAARAKGVTNNLMASFVAMGVPAQTPGCAQHGEANTGTFGDASTDDTYSVGAGGAEEYGRVMDAAGFVGWLEGSPP